MSDIFFDFLDRFDAALQTVYICLCLSVGSLYALIFLSSIFGFSVAMSTVWAVSAAPFALALPATVARGLLARRRRRASACVG